MRRTYRKKKWKPDKTEYRANERIRVPEVRVLDAEGNMIGVMTTKKAIESARDAGYDLVEVNPKADPPLTKFTDFGRMQYEREKLKQKQKAKQKKVEVKGVRLSFRISDHDRDVRLKQTKKFLEKGNKVKIELIVKGRENAHISHAFEKARQFVEDLKVAMEGKELDIEQVPKKEGHRITSIVGLKS